MNPRIAKSGGDILGQPVNKCSLRFLFSFFNFTIDNEKHNGSFIRMDTHTQAVATLSDITEKVDVVDVFMRSDRCALLRVVK